MAHWAEPFTDVERARLTPHVSNVDRPVFTLRALPQVTCAALFARYSRSAKSLRRLLLDEFLTGPAPGGGPGDAGRERAGDLFGRVLAEYGDDSVAQLAGVHLACEQVSQPLAKAIEWGRLAGYLEQSTRYIAYTDRRDGHYRYRRDPAVLASRHAGAYLEAMDGLFDTYARLMTPLREHLDAVLPRPGDGGDPAGREVAGMTASPDDARARRAAVRALALDLLRGLLPAATVSNVGIFASAQSLEQMVLRLRAHPLPEARECAELIAAELRGAIPELVSRLDRPDRGGAWAEYLRSTAGSLRQAATGLGVRSRSGVGDGRAQSEGVRLLAWDDRAEDRILAAALFPHAEVGEEALLAAIAGLDGRRRAELFAAAVGDRLNRRHRPGRGFEHCDYTFEIVVDYGAFRDLQRHRMCTIQWQELTPALGFTVPAAVEAAGAGGEWRVAVERAETVWSELRSDLPEEAGYLVTLGHRLRCLVRLNAREAMHIIELRTSPQGHPSYRRICQEMLRQIREVAGHRLVAGAMRFAGRGDVHLPRYAAEAARGVAGGTGSNSAEGPSAPSLV